MIVDPVIPDADWEEIQKETETDILTIVMNCVEGRTAAGETVNQISDHCQAAYLQGMKCLDAEREALRELRERVQYIADQNDLAGHWAVEIAKDAIKQADAHKRPGE